jgi:3-oxo-5-alpha-steroid 4-dehydrogenase 1
MHGYLNAKWFGKHGKRFTSREYFKSPNFIIGIILYYTGFFLIMQQDGIMRQIRDKPDARRYEIPYGGVWDYSTSANYFVELIAWFGFWVLSDFGPNGAFIFSVSLFNLVPRALTNYNWYVAKFGEEFTSLNRAVLIPGIW